MLLKYKINNINIYEKFFAEKENDFNVNSLKFIVYRDARVNLKFWKYKQDIKYTLINDLSKEEDEIFASFTSNIRNEIRKVEKIDNFSYSYNTITMLEFIEFYNSFAISKGLNPLRERRIKKYAGNLFYLSAYLKDKLTNVQVYIVDKENKIVRLLYSVSTIHSLEDKQRRKNIGFINKFLHWQAISYFKKNNFLIFDWGGYGNDPNNKTLAGIDKFKKSFGGEIIEIYDYYSIPFFILKSIKNKIGLQCSEFTE